MLTFVKSALKNKIFWYLASRYGTFAIQFLTSIGLTVRLKLHHLTVKKALPM